MRSPRIAGDVLNRLILAVTEMISHLNFQRPLNQQPGELLEQPILANKVFWLPVISQQAIQQLLGYSFFPTVIIGPGNVAVSCRVAPAIRARSQGGRLDTKYRRCAET